MDESELFKSIEILIAYFLPGILFSLLIFRDLINIVGLFPEKNLSFSLQEYTVIGIIMGPLLRGCDTLLLSIILKFNIFNHFLFIKYNKLRKNWSDVLCGRRKYILISKLDNNIRNIENYLESLTDGYLWTSFILFLKFLSLLLLNFYLLSLLTLLLSWIILYEGIDYGNEYVELLREGLKFKVRACKQNLPHV